MIPKLNAKGHSFKGVTAYLMHDVGETERDDRVAFTHTRNLATDDLEIAARIMAAHVRMGHRFTDRGQGRRLTPESQMSAFGCLMLRGKLLDSDPAAQAKSAAR